MASIWQRLLAGAAFTAVMIITFLAYLRPDFVMDLAVRVISCF